MMESDHETQLCQPRGSPPESESESADPSNVVRLNVGGVLYITTRTTLLEHENSYFTGLLSGRFDVTKLEDGSVFIDRNGALFAPILEFMRTGMLRIPPGTDHQAVLDEADFYCLNYTTHANKRSRTSPTGSYAMPSQARKAFPALLSALQRPLPSIFYLESAVHRDQMVHELRIFLGSKRKYERTLDFRNDEDLAAHVEPCGQQESPFSAHSVNIYPSAPDYETGIITEIMGHAFMNGYTLLDIKTLHYDSIIQTRMWMHRPVIRHVDDQTVHP